MTTSTTAEEKAPPEPQYATVWLWVEDWFVINIRRRVNASPGKGLTWDPAWWKYPEVVARMLALHAAWEEAHASASASAMSSWFVSHLEPHLRVLFDGETGPMSLASADPNFSGHAPLATEPVPDDVRNRHQPVAALTELEPLFPTVWEWMEGWFVKVVRRRILSAAGKGLSWDPMWWQYPEVVERFAALHAAWEHARVAQSPSAMSTWWCAHLDAHLRVIFDNTTGPMSQAGAAGFAGHPQLEATPLPEVVKRQLAPAA
ncbi:DUF4913 domain-containing protein [Nocardia suismassiliense]|uniref:DUF4913 domain-containing protein n=1 Tax=Nocardia suismassiliense TaxID=2077092 RepID=UPI000D1DB5CA|nr:DUF4913 domain-containing protein [Nocardia suismassiliense]